MQSCFGTSFFHLHQKSFQIIATFCQLDGVICIYLLPPRYRPWGLFPSPLRQNLGFEFPPNYKSPCLGFMAKLCLRLSHLFQCGFLLAYSMCRSVACSQFLRFFPECSYRFGMSMRRSELRVFQYYYLEPEPPLIFIFQRHFYWMQYCQLIMSFNSQKILFYNLLANIVSDEKFTVNHFFVYIGCHVFLVVLNIFSLSLLFNNLIQMCFGVVFLMFLLFGIFTTFILQVYIFQQILQVFTNCYFFKCFSISNLSLSLCLYLHICQID